MQMAVVDSHSTTQSELSCIVSDSSEAANIKQLVSRNEVFIALVQ